MTLGITHISLLTTPITVEYNGVSFGQADLKTQIGMECVYDRANRALEFVRCNFNFQRNFQAADIDGLLDKLTAPAGMLRLNGLGWKDITLNDPSVRSGPADCEFGPHPKVIRLTPKGSGNLWWELDFQLEASIPFCFEGTPLYSSAIQALNYTVSFDLDDYGLTTRHISGFLRIPTTRRSATDRALYDNADAYRDVINPEVPLAFRRGPRHWGLSDDKRTLNFDLTDIEINSDSPYPEGIVKISASESLTNQGLDMTRWNYSLSGTLEVARPYPKSLAWEKFSLLASDRRQYQDQAAKTIRWGQNQGNITGGVMMVTNLFLEDEIFERRSQFSIRWVLLTTLKDLLRVSGFFRPANGDWNTWRTSMKLVWSNRGTANMRFENSQDLIIDLCQQGTSSTLMPSERSQQDSTPIPQPTGCPSRETSWIRYDSKVLYANDPHLLVHKELPLPSYSQNPNKHIRDLGELPPDPPDGDSGREDAVQYRLSPSNRVVLVGYAERVGYDIEVPDLRTALNGAGVTPDVSRSKIIRGTIGNAGPCPIYQCSWWLEYVLQNPPSQLVDQNYITWGKEEA